MIRSLLLALCIATSLARADDAAPQTGNFTTTFTQRSPLSSLKTMTQRMRLPKDAADYDGSSEKWLIHVPPTYTPDKPMGLIVQLIFRDKDSYINDECCKRLDDRNIAFACRRDGGGDPVAKAGEAIDAAYNLQQMYKIDLTRIYLFYFVPITDQHEFVGEQLFTGYPDVFTGALLNNIGEFWTPYRAPNGNTYPGRLPAPPPQYKTAAAKHPLYLTIVNNDAVWITALGKAWTSQGFKNVRAEPVEMETTHYPNFSPDWLSGVVDYLDQHKAATPHPTSAKTTEK